MEVKIDADELCELRKRANDCNSGYTPELGWITFDELLNKYRGAALELAARNARLACYNDDGLTKMTKERDWWRDEAFRWAESYQTRVDIIRFSVSNSIENPVKKLKDYADSSGMDYSL